MRAAKHSGGKSDELVRTREKGREGSPLAGRRRKFGVAQGAKKSEPVGTHQWERERREENASVVWQRGWRQLEWLWFEQ